MRDGPAAEPAHRRGGPRFESVLGGRWVRSPRVEGSPKVFEIEVARVTTVISLLSQRERLYVIYAECVSCAPDPCGVSKSIEALNAQGPSRRACSCSCGEPLRPCWALAIASPVWRICALPLLITNPAFAPHECRLRARVDVLHAPWHAPAPRIMDWAATACPSLGMASRAPPSHVTRHPTLTLASVGSRMGGSSEPLAHPPLTQTTTSQDDTARRRRASANSASRHATCTWEGRAGTRTTHSGSAHANQPRQIVGRPRREPVAKLRLRYMQHTQVQVPCAHTSPGSRVHTCTTTHAAHPLHAAASTPPLRTATRVDPPVRARIEAHLSASSPTSRTAAEPA